MQGNRAFTCSGQSVQSSLTAWHLHIVVLPWAQPSTWCWICGAFLFFCACSGQSASVVQSFWICLVFKSYLLMVCFPKTHQNTELELARCKDLPYLSNNFVYTLHCNEWLTKFIAICSTMPRFVDERGAVDAIYLSFCSKASDNISHNTLVSKLVCYDLDGGTTRWVEMDGWVQSGC